MTQIPTSPAPPLATSSQFWFGVTGIIATILLTVIAFAFFLGGLAKDIDSIKETNKTITGTVNDLSGRVGATEIFLDSKHRKR